MTSPPLGAATGGGPDAFITGARGLSNVGWLATILGFGVTIVAILLLYRIAYEASVDMVRGAFGGTITQTISLVITTVLLIVFIALGQWAGRMTRDWINHGRRSGPPARRTA